MFWKRTSTIGLFLLDNIVSVASENNAFFEDGTCTSPTSVLVLAALLAPIGVLDLFVLNSLNCFLFFGNQFFLLCPLLYGNLHELH